MLRLYTDTVGVIFFFLIFHLRLIHVNNASGFSWMTTLSGSVHRVGGKGEEREGGSTGPEFSHLECIKSKR